MEKTVTLRPPTAADDLSCPDGELEVYPLRQPGVTTPASKRTLLSEQAVAVADDTLFLAMHSLPGGGANAIVASVGFLGFIDMKASRPALIRILPLSELPPLARVVGVGLWLVISCADGSLLYARWNGSGYDWLGEAPGSPTGGVAAVSKAFPPFSYSDGEWPVLTVLTAVSDPDADVTNWLAGRGSGNVSEATRTAVLRAVTEALEGLVTSAKSAGLYLSPVMATLSYRLDCGRLFAPAEPRLVGGAVAPLSLAISGFSCIGGNLYMALSLNRRPFAVETTGTDVGADARLTAFGIVGTHLYVSEGPGDFRPEAVGGPLWLDGANRGFSVGTRSVGTEDFGRQPNPLVRMPGSVEGAVIYGIGRTLFATAGSRVAQALPGYPFACVSESDLACGEIFYLTRSMLSSSAVANDGEVPLYAFCADGIRSLTPRQGLYRDSRLISRHVPIGPDCFAPLPDGTAFVTKAGVRKLSGSSVSAWNGDFLSAGDADLRDADSATRLLYIYKENELWTYREEKGSAVLSHHYAWPDTYALRAGKDGLSIGVLISELSTGAILPDSPMVPDFPDSPKNPEVAIATRPLKLGSPFSLKVLEEVEAVWPDGICRPLKVYGAVKPGRWRFLGLGRRGRLLMRGSGWRLFRIETFGTSASLPIIRFKFK